MQLRNILYYIIFNFFVKNKNSAAVVSVIVVVVVAPVNVPKSVNVASSSARVADTPVKEPKAPPAQVNEVAAVFANVKPVGAVILPICE